LKNREQQAASRMKTLIPLVLCIALGPLQARAESPAVRQCRIHVQGKIDMVDAEMHKGHKANEAQKLVARRDRLRAQYRTCDQNPNAYKKNL